MVSGKRISNFIRQRKRASLPGCSFSSSVPILPHLTNRRKGYLMKTTGLGGLILAVMLTPCFQACAGTYSGTISVKGNMPFTYLALSTNTGDMKIVGTLKQKLWDCCQGRRVTVKGSIISAGAGFLQPPEIEVTEIMDGGR
jgi:hypothetical protein